MMLVVVDNNVDSDINEVSDTEISVVAFVEVPLLRLSTGTLVVKRNASLSISKEFSEDRNADDDDGADE